MDSAIKSMKFLENVIDRFRCWVARLTRKDDYYE